MGRIFYMMGKSASGKDSLHNALMEDPTLHLNRVVLYTTRPQREGETNGREYFFIGEDRAKELEQSGKLIEERCYRTVHGPWKYMTVDDGQICLSEKNYLMIGTLESFRKMQAYFGKEKVVPLYIAVEDGERLQRALNREKEQPVPGYAEMCRRFLADEADFSAEKRKEAGIEVCFENDDFNECIRKLREAILSGK